MIILIDEVDEDIGNWLVLEKSDAEFDGLEPYNKTVVVFKHLGYESLVCISSYSGFQGVFARIWGQVHAHIEGDTDIIVHEGSVGLQFGFGMFGVFFRRIASQFDCSLN